jgi:flagellar assembly factor FliW
MIVKFENNKISRVSVGRKYLKKDEYFIPEGIDALDYFKNLNCKNYSNYNPLLYSINSQDCETSFCLFNVLSNKDIYEIDICDPDNVFKLFEIR